MSELKNLRGKQIWVYLKQGMTADDLAQRYECTHEDFFEFLEKNFEGRSYKAIKRTLDKNIKKNKSSNVNVLVGDAKSTINQLRKQGKQIQEKNVMTQKSNGKNSQSSDLQELENLKNREKALTTEICNQEVIHKNSISEKRKLYEKLSGEKEKLLQLKEIIEQSQKNVEDVSIQIAEIEEKITTENEQIISGKKMLQEVRNSIKKLEKITVFIYDSGEIKAENTELPELTGAEDVFDSLIHNELVEELSVKQIRQLAKLMILTEQMEKQQKTFELVFESEKQQKIFEQL